jgi:hypothetical protein
MKRFLVTSLLACSGIFADVKLLELEAGITPWARQNLPPTILAYETVATTTAPVIIATDLAKINQWVPGLFARVAVLPTDEYGIEARYLGLLQWSRVYAISTTGTSPTYSLAVTNVSPITFTGASQVIEDYKMRYESGDLLFLWNISPLYDQFFGVRGLLGPSYIFLEDKLDQTISSLTFLKEYNIKSTNNLVGLRAYGEWIGTPEPFIWGVRGSFGVYGDIYRQVSTISQSIPVSATANYRFVASTAWASTLFQGEVFLGINLFNSLRIKGAFGGEWLNYIGSAVSQPGRGFQTGSIYHKNHFLFYGANISVEWDLF